jgi:hypothetical protein
VLVVGFSKEGDRQQAHQPAGRPSSCHTAASAGEVGAWGGYDLGSPGGSGLPQAAKSNAEHANWRPGSLHFPEFVAELSDEDEDNKIDICINIAQDR